MFYGSDNYHNKFTQTLGHPNCHFMLMLIVRTLGQDIDGKPTDCSIRYIMTICEVSQSNTAHINMLKVKMQTTLVDAMLTQGETVLQIWQVCKEHLAKWVGRSI